MSQLEKLLSEIGFEVQKLTNQIQTEKNSMADLQRKLVSLNQETESQKHLKKHLEEEIAQLEATYFRQRKHSDQVSKINDILNSQIQSLEDVLASINSSNMKIRDERMNCIMEYKKKLEAYNEYMNENERLKGFVELWKTKVSENCQLISIPDLVRELARNTAQFYDKPLEEALDDVMDKSLKCDENDPLETVQSNQEEYAENDAVIQQPSSYPLQCKKMDCDLDAQVKECDGLDASRLRVSVLDTSTLCPIRDGKMLFEAKDMDDPTKIETDADGDVSSY